MCAHVCVHVCLCVCVHACIQWIHQIQRHELSLMNRNGIKTFFTPNVYLLKFILCGFD